MLASEGGYVGAMVEYRLYERQPPEDVLASSTCWAEWSLDEATPFGRSRRFHVESL